MRQITPRRGRPPSTSREEIVEHALRLLDERGVHGLTMKDLSASVGVTTMALYRHVADKENLLLLALDAIAEPFADVVFDQPPRERIVAAMTVTYDCLIEHPWVPEALIGPQRFGRGALHVTNAAIGGAYELSGDYATAVRAYRAIWSLTLGSVLTHLRQRAESRTDPAQWMQSLMDVFPADTAPHWHAAASVRVPPPGRDDFVAALGALLVGLFGPVQNP